MSFRRPREYVKHLEKLWYIGGDKIRNGVGILIDKCFKKVVEVRRIGDRIISIKFVLGEETINIISAYAPQIGLKGHGWIDSKVIKHEKDLYWRRLEWSCWKRWVGALKEFMEVRNME